MNSEQIINIIFITGIILAVIYGAALIAYIGLFSIPLNIISMIIFGNALGTWRDEEIKKCTKL